MISTEAARALRKTYTEFTEAGEALARPYIDEAHLRQRAEGYCRRRIAHQRAIERVDREMG